MTIRADHNGTVRCRTLAALIAEHQDALPSESGRGDGHRRKGQGGRRKVAERRMLAALAAARPAAVPGHKLCGASDWGVLLDLVNRGLVECAGAESFRLAKEAPRA